jgi:hypothetical protein
VEKYCRAGQGTDGSVIRRMRIAYGYLRLQTHTMCNTYCFSTVTMVLRTRLNVPFHVHATWTVTYIFVSADLNRTERLLLRL